MEGGKRSISENEERTSVFGTSVFASLSIVTMARPDRRSWR